MRADVRHVLYHLPGAALSEHCRRLPGSRRGGRGGRSGEAYILYVRQHILLLPAADRQGLLSLCICALPTFHGLLPDTNGILPGADSRMSNGADSRMSHTNGRVSNRGLPLRRRWRRWWWRRMSCGPRGNALTPFTWLLRKTALPDV
jgi:hypothetical protein